MLLSNFEEENLIAKNELSKHNVQRYEFKSIIKNKSDDIDETVSIIQSSAPNPNSSQDIQEAKKNSNSLEKDLIERLLQKTDELSSSLAKLQIQFEKQQLEIEERVAGARNDGYKDGIKEGEEKAKKEMLDMIEKEKTTLIQSAIALDTEMKRSQSHLEELEKELSGIAVDIAKEVIVKEIDSSSQKVALALAKELLSSIVDATDIHIKVNTNDYPYLNENLKDSQKIKLEPSDAISKGGVVITCSNGNIDGNIMTRYRTLKQSVLDNLRA
ncbi:flagellar assembly protein FliH [Helicobacter cappadocius]|uniref:Flagellar assembly protein FliH n=1 Tax=Helicobacter cappadocius TaxID=3063998 RepID=A0AA90PK57_9HELI|nr:MULTISPECIES: flagellar assembly protein FliH [unclassified Helicobacter]MDO7253474.1 flagellar assembly protein FliH [Helicobacter sp. faydin-H75]MDP2539401.1 flagellar assembly protein FliH [Helicobacter sp. faydin-H76]